MRSILIVAFLAIAAPLNAQAPSPTWQLVEVLRIGSIDGPGALSKVSSITVSPDGTMLYVAQPLEHAIRVFDAASGKPLRTIGRHGEGPGEFRSLSMIGWTADTLYATDFLLRRFSLFSQIGDHLSTERINPPIQPETRRGSYPIGLTADGNVISVSVVPSAMTADGRVTSSPWALVGRDSKVIRTLAKSEWRDRTGVARAGTRIFYFAQPMSQRNYLALHPHGTSVVVVNQPAGNDPAGNYEVVRLRPDGRRTTRSYRYTPLPVSSALADSLRGALASDLALAIPSGQARQAAREYMTVPSTHPPVSSAVVGRDDSVWLRKENVGGVSVRWLVLDPEGSIRARVVAPAGLTVLYVDESTVWGTVQDELDIPYVIRFRIRR